MKYYRTGFVIPMPKKRWQRRLLRVALWTLAVLYCFTWIPSEHRFNRLVQQWKRHFAPRPALPAEPIHICVEVAAVLDTEFVRLCDPDVRAIVPEVQLRHTTGRGFTLHPIDAPQPTCPGCCAIYRKMNER